LFRDTQEAAEQSGFEQEIAKITKVKGTTQIGSGDCPSNALNLDRAKNIAEAATEPGQKVQSPSACSGMRLLDS
jgi:hypothetical protein